MTFSSFSLLILAARRIWHQRLLMLSLLAGLIAAAGLLSSIPLYADAAQNRLLQGELTEAGAYRPPFAFLWRYIGAWNGDVTWTDYQPIDEYLSAQAPGVVGLPLDEQIRHVSTAKLRLFPGAGVGFNEGEPLIWANVGFITGLENEIELVEGRYPAEDTAGPAVEVIVNQATAESLGLQTGEAYTLFGPGGDGTQLPLQIVGVWRPVDETASFWFYQPDAFEEMLLTSEGQFGRLVVPALENPVSTAVWYQLYDGRRTRPATVNELLEKIAAVEARATALLDGTTLDASPVTALQGYGRSNRLLILILTIFSLPLVGLTLYFISLIASMVVQRGQGEIALMRSRGTTRGQIALLYLLEGLLVGLPGLAGGLLLGRWLAQLMGRARTFLDPALFQTAGPDSLAPVLSGTAVFYALTAVGLAILALLIPALTHSRHTTVTLRREQARALRPPLWQRYYLDLFLLILPLYGWYQLRRGGSIGLLGGGNDPFANPLLFLVPILFTFALSLLGIRAFPWLMRLLAWLAEKLPGVTLLLILRQLARATAQYTGPLLLLSLTVSLAVFTASMAVTLDDHLTDRVYYQVGADLNLAELGESTEDPNQSSVNSNQLSVSGNQSSDDEPRWLFLPVEEHLRVPGVRVAARVGNYSATANIGGRQQAGRLMGIDRVDFPQAAFYRPDFANNESLGGLMNRLAARPDNILVSRDFLARHNMAVGDPLRLTVGAAGDFADVEFTIAGPLDLFPTLYPQDGPFFVANLNYIFAGLGGTYPYDVWLATAPSTSSEQIVKNVRELGIIVVTAQDARAQILAEQTRPERQGLFGLLSVGFLAAAALTVLGFLVYAVVSFQRRFIELGMLRAIGLSVGQMAVYLAGEQAVVILAGMGLGTGLGVWASRLFIPFLQVGEGKTAIIPPFVVQIAWAQLGTIYALFGMMFVTAVVILIFLLLRMKLFEAVKLGEAV
ncbi:MAG TPA: ABC transporter permease [Anaerolineae bacterium]|nr:ABC transporter permease [Anaerolineae bacterium]HIP70749.1 ABC transporter permease [Anaerolineae bacterium]